MLDIDSEQPPDWMRFAETSFVQWGAVEEAVDAIHETVRQEATLLVAILRAGCPIAALLARKTGLPLDYLLCNRVNPSPVFVDGIARAPRGHKILLVDDVCGTGWTFSRAKAYCEDLGNTVMTFSIYRCDAPGMFRPDYSQPIDADTYLRWPWEYQCETEMPDAMKNIAADGTRQTIQATDARPSR